MNNWIGLMLMIVVVTGIVVGAIAILDAAGATSISRACEAKGGAWVQGHCVALIQLDEPT